MLRGSSKCVEVMAETSTPAELRVGNNSTSEANRARFHLPKLEFVVDAQGAVLRGPQRAAFPFFHTTSAVYSAGMMSPNMLRSQGALCRAMEANHMTGANEQKGTLMKECILNDTRATTLAIKYDDDIGKFICGSSIERFSGHTGVCRVLGSKKYPVIPHNLQVGDLLRIGSVGLVVCEMNRTADESTQEALTEDEYLFLKEHYLSLPLQQTFHPPDARYHEAQDNQEPSPECPKESNRAGETSDEGESEEDRHLSDDGNNADQIEPEDAEQRVHYKARGPQSKMFCYICYDCEDEPDENPLVAPCNCKGDTKYVHLECLQRWNNNLDADGSTANQKVCAVTNTDGLDVCTICKATYSTSVRLENGRVVSLLAKKLPPPYVTLAVVTQHETRSRSTALTNTRFQLSFANLPKDDQILTIGRSTSNNMTLRYRTVSQLHAKVKYENNQFSLHDAESSNGTMLFLSRPLELEWGKSSHVKIGRTILTLKPKRPRRWSVEEGESGMMQQERVENNAEESSRPCSQSLDHNRGSGGNRFIADICGRGARVADPSLEWLTSPFASSQHFQSLGSPRVSERCPFTGRMSEPQPFHQSPVSNRHVESESMRERLSNLSLRDGGSSGRLSLSTQRINPHVESSFARNESNGSSPRNVVSSGAQDFFVPSSRFFLDSATDRHVGDMSYLSGMQSPTVEVAPIAGDGDLTIHEF